MPSTFTRLASTIVAVFFFAAMTMQGVAQPFGSDASTVQGQPAAPGTSVLPQGSPPALTQPGGRNNIRAVAAGDLVDMAVVNDDGDPLGVVTRILSGAAGRLYAVIEVESARQRAVLPLALMQINRDELVIRGYGIDALRAQPVDDAALDNFSEVHSSIAVEFMSLDDENLR